MTQSLVLAIMRKMTLGFLASKAFFIIRGAFENPDKKLLIVMSHYRNFEVYFPWIGSALELEAGKTRSWNHVHRIESTFEEKMFFSVALLR